MAEDQKEELGDAIKSFNRGLNSHIERNLEKALDLFQTALPTFQEFGVEDMIAGTLHEMGMIFQEQGDYEEALDYLQRSLELSTKIKYIAGQAKTLFQIGAVHEEKGDIITANEYYARAEKVGTKRPGALTFIIITLLFQGLFGLGTGIGGASGILIQFRPGFVTPGAWGDFVGFMTVFGPLMGIPALIAVPGLFLLKGWGWVMGVFTCIITVIIISGIPFLWYLSQDPLKELYGIK